jgi:hypothetical protein
MGCSSLEAEPGSKIVSFACAMINLWAQNSHSTNSLPGSETSASTAEPAVPPAVLSLSSCRHKLVASLIEALPGGGITTPGPDRGGSNTTVMGGMAQRLHAESERVGDELRVAQDRAQVLKYARTQWTSMLDMMRGEGWLSLSTIDAV